MTRKFQDGPYGPDEAALSKATPTMTTNHRLVALHHAVEKMKAQLEAMPTKPQEAFSKADVDELAAKFEAQKGVSKKRAQAMAVARCMADAGAYEAAFLASPPTVEADPVEKSDTGAAFEKAVTDIRARDKCSRVIAMQKARKEAPEAYEAFCEA